MQPMWLFILSGKLFEGSFENTQWGKVEQMQPVWLCLLWSKLFESTFENAQWRKVNKCIWGNIWKHIWRISFQNSLSPLEAWEKNIHFSFSSQKSRICFQISLSLLKVGEQHFKFLCLFSKMVNLFSLSLSPFEAWEKNIPFSFSSRKLRIFFQISLSLLKTGERIFKFLLLLSKLEKIISNFSFSSRLDFLGSRHTLGQGRQVFPDWSLRYIPIFDGLVQDWHGLQLSTFAVSVHHSINNHRGIGKHATVYHRSDTLDNSPKGWVTYHAMNF